MNPLPLLRFRIVHGVLVAFVLAILVKAAHVQLLQHDRWLGEAEKQQLAESSRPAPRGDIEDEEGLPMARSRDLVRLSVARREVKEPKRLYRAMVDAGVPVTEARRALDPKSKWVELRRPYAPTAMASVLRFPGVHASEVGGREYVQSEGLRKVLGGLGRDGNGAWGLELYFDSLLKGQPGRARTIRGLKGARFESPEFMSEAPRPGHHIRLTINQTMQDICDKVLADAVVRSAADGGDIVVMDPATGELRCLASRRRQASGAGPTALIEPFEPGSTLKPFYAGYMLERGLVKLDEQIETFGGSYTIHGRTITDVHKGDRMTLADVIRFSSNVGIARFTERLRNGEIYQLLRDLGFGTQTGIPYPSEAAGTLWEPKRWSLQSPASLAIGYELAVTPLQLVTAYSALANGGWILAPALVKEIRTDDGAVLYRHEPRRLRRILNDSTTRTVLAMLESVVDSGTAEGASLSTFRMAGKSGTARRSTGGSYGAASYTASFVGLFPAQSPVYVVLAKLDNPRGDSYYGGKTAAPLAKAVIEGALAARSASVDWAHVARQQDVPERIDEVVSTAVELDSAAPMPIPTVPLIDTVREVPPPAAVTIRLNRAEKDTSAVNGSVLVPNVARLPLRVALRELHRAGLRVQVVDGLPGATSPASGSAVPRGSLVRLGRP